MVAAIVHETVDVGAPEVSDEAAIVDAVRIIVVGSNGFETEPQLARLKKFLGWEWARLLAAVRGAADYLEVVEPDAQHAAVRVASARVKLNELVL